MPTVARHSIGNNMITKKFDILSTLYISNCKEVCDELNIPFSDDWLKFSDEDFLRIQKRQNELAMLRGVELGWWEAFDEIGPMRVFRKKIDECQNKTLAHLWAELGAFPSVSEANRNGWNLPVIVGEFNLKRKRMRLIVE